LRQVLLLIKNLLKRILLKLKSLKKRIIFLDLPTMSLNLSCGLTNNNLLANQ